MEIQQRLEIFLERLNAAPACKSAEEALALVSRLIEEVEDEFCPVSREDPPPMRFTGRMYAPKPDRVRRTPHGLLVASSRHHRIFCQLNGAIRIEYIPSMRIIIDKSGLRS
jgi:hypothetical protein